MSDDHRVRSAILFTIQDSVCEAMNKQFLQLFFSEPAKNKTTGSIIKSLFCPRYFKFVRSHSGSNSGVSIQYSRQTLNHQKHAEKSFVIKFNKNMKDPHHIKL